MVSKFSIEELVVLIDGKKTDEEVLRFYRLPLFVRNKIGVIVSVHRNCHLVKFFTDKLDKDNPVEYLVPNSMLKTYVKEPGHRLTKVFM